MLIYDLSILPLHLSPLREVTSYSYFNIILLHNCNIWEIVLTKISLPKLHRYDEIFLYGSSSLLKSIPLQLLIQMPFTSLYLVRTGFKQ